MGREDIVPHLEHQMRRYKITRDIENIKSMSMILFNKAAIDGTILGYAYADLAPYFVYFAANQVGYPFQLGSMKRRMGKKFDLGLFTRIGSVLETMGFHRKQFPLERYAKIVSETSWFPGYMKETFIEMAKKLSAFNIRGISPRKLCCAMINLSAKLHGRSYSYKKCCNNIRVHQGLDVAFKFVKDKLGDEYKW